MYFRHTPQIWQAFPELAAGTLFVPHVNTHTNVELYLDPFFQRARTSIQTSTEADMPEIAAWRRAFAKMGLKPTQYRSAAEALLRRFRKEDDLPRLHPLVDLCNAVSLTYALPIAVFDVERVASFIEVCHATGGENYLAFSGEIEHPDPQEIVFVDAEQQVHARRWTFRQSRQSTVSDTTSQALIVCEGLHDTANDDVQAVLTDLGQTISTVWTTDVQQSMLTAAQPQFDFA
ncbi:MAG: phenylalanine--tRNA ligase beta subunit-related protein [Chloroflexota bacterium]